MADERLMSRQHTYVGDEEKITTLEFLLPNHAIVFAINAEVRKEYCLPFIFFAGDFLDLDAITVNPDGRILEGRPVPVFDGCHNPIVYKGQRQGEDYQLAFHPIDKVEITTRVDVIHKPVIDEMVAVMEEAYQIGESE